MRSRFPSGIRSLLLLMPLTALATVADGGLPSVAVAPPFAIGLPDKAWQVVVAVPGFEMGPVQQLHGGARALGTVEASGWEISLTLANSPGDPSAKSCRDHDWAGRQKATPHAEAIRLSGQGDQARVDFLVPDGGTALAKHVLLYLQREGVCVVVHLSKLHYVNEDARAFERILGSARFGS